MRARNRLRCLGLDRLTVQFVLISLFVCGFAFGLAHADDKADKKEEKKPNVFKTWLLTIAWNQAINRRRANTRWWRRIVDVGAAVAADSVNRLDRAGDPAALTSTSDTPEQLAAAAELRRDIRRAIAQLPRKLRDALLLAQSGEYSYQEIGAMLGAPLGTIKWRVSEARRVIRKQLQNRGHGDVG